MKRLWSEKFLKLSERGRKPKKQNSIRKYPKNIILRKSVKHYSYSELIEWGNKNGIRVVRDLWRLASIKEDTPTFRNILEEFGSWGRYKKELNISKKGFIKDMTDEEYIQLCVKLGVKGTVIDYMNKYNRYKGLLINYNNIIKKFGNWYNFKRLINCFNVDKLLEDYVENSIEYGHALTLKECDELGIEIRRAMNLYGRRVFNALIREKEKQIYLKAIKE